MRSARKGSIGEAWSPDRAEASREAMSLTNRATRGPDWPRISGLPAEGPKLLFCTPGMRARVSPRLGARARSST
jgi:hypothetical protein